MHILITDNITLLIEVIQACCTSAPRDQGPASHGPRAVGSGEKSLKHFAYGIRNV